MESNFISRIQLKALMLSVITEIKFKQPLAKNARFVKSHFKKIVGLKPNADNKTVLKEMKRVYTENGLVQDFEQTLEKFKLTLD